MSPPTEIHQAIMRECERQRQTLGFAMERFSEFAGLPDRYFSKALHADTPSGRQAQWSTLQIMMDALFPDGFKVTITPKPGPLLDQHVQHYRRRFGPTIIDRKASKAEAAARECA